MTAPRARVRRDGRQWSSRPRRSSRRHRWCWRRGTWWRRTRGCSRRTRCRRTRPPLTGESAPVDKLAPTPARRAAGRAERLRLPGNLGGGGDRGGRGDGDRDGDGAGQDRAPARDGGGHETPLQERLERVSRVLLLLCLASSSVTAAVGLARGLAWLEVFMSAVSLAVAAVPEGLPAIVTIALAIGVQRMSAAPRAHPPAAGGRDAGKRDRDLHGQDRDAHHRRHGGARAVGRGSPRAARRGRGLLRRRAGGRWPDRHRRSHRAGAARGGRRAGHRPARPSSATGRAGTRPRSTRAQAHVRRPRGRRALRQGRAGDAAAAVHAGTAGAAEANAEMARAGCACWRRGRDAGRRRRTCACWGWWRSPIRPAPRRSRRWRRRASAGIRTVMITGDHPVTARAIARELGIVREGEDRRIRPRARDARGQAGDRARRGRRAARSWR